MALAYLALAPRCFFPSPMGLSAILENHSIEGQNEWIWSIRRTMPAQHISIKNWGRERPIHSFDLFLTPITLLQPTDHGEVFEPGSSNEQGVPGSVTIQDFKNPKRN